MQPALRASSLPGFAFSMKYPSSSEFLDVLTSSDRLSTTTDSIVVESLELADQLRDLPGTGEESAYTTEGCIKIVDADHEAFS